MEWDILWVTVTAIGSAIMTGIAILFFYQVYQYTKSHPKCATAWGFIHGRNSAGVLIVAYTVVFCVNIYDGYGDSYAAKLLEYVCNYISWSAFLFFHIARLYHTFNTTAHALSKYQIIILTILFIISIIVGIFELFCIFGSWFDEHTIRIAKEACPGSFYLPLEYIYHGEVIAIPSLVSFLFAKKLITILVGLKQTVVMEGGIVELTYNSCSGTFSIYSN